MAKYLAVKVDDNDNVATIFAEGTCNGVTVEVKDKKGGSQVLNVIGDIPYGHKIALADIPPGEAIRKYGESIGAASRPILKGEYVHIHNLDSMRGRGDLS